MADRRLLLLIVAVIALGIAVIVLWSRRPDTDRAAPPQPEELSPAATEEPPREPITVIAAADIACDPDEDGFRDGEGREGVCQQMATSELALAAEPDLVLIPGDTQYEEAELDDYRESFHPSRGPAG